MTRLSREELEEIVETQLPGYVLVQEPLEDYGQAEMEAEAVTPDLETLRDKYEGYISPTNGTTPDHEGQSPVGSSEAEDVVVKVEPRDAHDAWITGPGPKAVVISSEDRRIVSVQG